MPFPPPDSGGGGGAPSPHALDSAHHSGVLADAQIPATIARDSELVHALDDGAVHTLAGAVDGEYLRATGPATFDLERFVTEYSLLALAVGTQFLNLGAGPQDLGTNIRAVADLSNVTQVRMTLLCTIAGVTGDCKLQYSNDNATWFDLTTNLIDLSSMGIKASTWEDIPVGAKADLIIVRAAGVNGNGTEDPTVTGVALQVR